MNTLQQAMEKICNLLRLSKINSVNFNSVEDLMYCCDMLIIPIRKNILDKALPFPILIKTADENYQVLYRQSFRSFLYDSQYQRVVKLVHLNVEDIKQSWIVMPGLSDISLSTILRFFKRECFMLLGMSALLSLFPVVLLFYAGSMISNGLSSGSIGININLLLGFLFSLLFYLNSDLILCCCAKLNICFVPNILRQMFNIDLDLVASIPQSALLQFFSEVEGALSQLLPSIIEFTLFSLSSIFLLGCIAWLSPKYAILAILLSVILFFIKWQGIHKQKINQINAKNIHQMLRSVLTDIFFNISKIRLRHLEDIFINRWLAVVKQINGCEIQIQKHNLTIDLIDMLVPCTIIFIYFILGSKQTNNYFIILFLLIHFNLMLQKQFKSMTQIILDWPKLKLPPLLNKVIMFSPNLSQMTLNDSLAIKDLSFFYPQRSNLLNNVNLYLKTGEFIGLTGASGSGKTTLIHLLLGLIKDYQGSILVGGIDRRSIPNNTFYKHVGAILQSSTLLPGTIFTNIVCGSNVTLEEAWFFAEMLGLADDLKNMPMQMFTYISDQAHTCLSGGQIQKIMLARALIRKPKILLLDEATASLDNISQQRVCDYLNKLQVTGIMISHRATSLYCADKIYTLKNGILSLL